MAAHVKHRVTCCSLARGGQVKQTRLLIMSVPIAGTRTALGFPLPHTELPQASEGSYSVLRSWLKVFMMQQVFGLFLGAGGLLHCGRQ